MPVMAWHQLLLTALGVTAAQRLHHNGGLLLSDDLVHGVDAVLLVVLNADDDLVHAEHLGQIGSAADDLLGTLQHGPVVAGDVGLALSAVDDARSFTLPMPPEILTCVGKVAPPIPTIPAFFTISTISSTVRASGSAGAFTSSLTVFWKSFSITTDTMSPPMEIGPGLDGLHRTGNAGMDRGAQPLEFADFLTHLYLVAYFYDRGAGCAKVHRHGDDHR